MKTDKRNLIIAISAVSVTLIAILAFLFMFLPIWPTNPLKNTLEELVGDIDWIDDVAGNLEDDGYKITATGNLAARVTELQSAFELEYTGYGRDDGFHRSEIKIDTPTKAFTLSIMYDDTSVAIGGYDEDGGYLLLPRENVVEALDASVLNPENNSVYALDADAYEELCSYFEVDEGDEQLAEEIEKFIENVLERSEKIIQPESKIRFAEGAFRLEKVTTVTLTPEDIEALLDIVEEEIDVTEQLAESLAELDYTTVLTGIRESLADTTLTVSYTLSKSMLTAFSIKVENGAEDSADAFEIIFALTDDGFVMNGVSDSGEDGTSKHEELEVEYTRADNSKKTEVALSAVSTVTTVDTRGVEETQTDEYTLTLDYDKKSGAYELNMPIEGDRPACFKGSFEKQSRDRGVYFTLDEMLVFDLPRNTERIFELRIEESREAKGMTLPEGTDFLSADENTAGPILKSLPIKPIEELITEITGSSLGLLYTTDGIWLPITEELEKEYTEAVTAYIDYLNEKIGGYKSYKKKVVYYSESCHKYILFSFNSGSGAVTADFACKLNSEQIKEYCPVTLEYGEIVIK